MDPNINSETGETITSGRSPRFTLWTAYLVFSIIVMTSAIQVKNAEDDIGDVSSASKYIVAISIVTFILTALIVGAHFNPIGTAIFVGTKVESVAIIVLVLCWTAIVAVNTDAGAGVGPPEDGIDTIQSANLYYFSWAGFITAVILLVSFLRDAFGVDVVGTMRGSEARIQWWAALLATSIIVLGSSARVNNVDCNDSEGAFSSTGKYCRIAKFAISASTIGMILCMLVIYTKVFKYTTSEPSSAFLLEVASSFFLSIMNVFVVYYVTSADGPGKSTGNLYYFSWGMFLTAIFLASQCYSAYANPTATSFDNNNETTGTTTNGNRGDVELQVETFDDNI